MLESEITKLIVYSNCETKLNIVLWRMSPEEDIIKTTARDECDLPVQIQDDRGMRQTC